MSAEEVTLAVVKVMLKKGIDILKNKPTPLEPRMFEETDRIIVMGCRTEGFCPANLLDKVDDWDLEDPKGKQREEVRMIRDQIECKFYYLSN